MIKALSFRVSVSDISDVQATADAAERAGFKLLPLEDPVTGIDIDGNELNMGRFVNDWWKRGAARGALVVNLREDVEYHLSREPQLPFGNVVVLTADGSINLEIKHLTKDQAEWLLEKITCSDLETAQEIEQLGTKLGATVVDNEPRPDANQINAGHAGYRSPWYTPDAPGMSRIYE